MRAWGVVLTEEPSGGQWLAMLVLGVVVVKELLLLALFATVGRPSADEAAVPLQCPDGGSGWTVLAGRFCHLVYAAVAMTACWDVVAAGTPVHFSNPPLAALELVSSVIFFLMIFIPVRGLVLWAEWVGLTGPAGRAVFLLSNAAVVVAALSVLPAA